MPATMTPPTPAQETPVDREWIDQVIASHKGQPGALLSVLEAVQERHERQYLPRETLIYVARRMRIPMSRIMSVVTFYAFFNLTPQGRHSVCICRGTACHTRGSRDLLIAAQHALGLNGEEEADKLSRTTEDYQFTLRTVACFGQCALAPVIEVDRKIYGWMNEREIVKLIDQVRREEKGA